MIKQTNYVRNFGREVVVGFPVAASALRGGGGRGVGVAFRGGVYGATSTVVVPWFPNNLARNSRAHLSNIEIRSLELQRLWRLLNDQANELRAKFLTRGLGGARSGLPRRFQHLVTGRWSPKVSEKVSSWRGEQGDSRDGCMSLE